jgi:Tetratricopeptide repeat
MPQVAGLAGVHGAAAPRPGRPDLTSGGMWRISQALGESGSYQAARDLCQEITAAHEQDPAYGPDHRETLAARVQLANWTGQAGDAAGARDQYAALLPIRERVSGAEHPDTLAARVHPPTGPRERDPSGPSLPQVPDPAQPRVEGAGVEAR